MVGTLIGQYKIVGIIGSGGMGTVYAGEHTLIKRRAAIKVLRPELSQRREIVDRFFNEARAAAAIQHPGVVQIFDFGFFDDADERRAYLVMELLDGKSLSSVLRDGGRLPEQDALRVVRQVASTIAAVHAAGIIHRDLKPDNIFLLPDPEVVGGSRVKILDFGIAKLGDAFEPSQTDAGGVFGTPHYMAPEQFDNKVDERSDIYALGCVLFEAVTGGPVFPGASLAQLVRSHLIQTPPRPSSVVPALSRDIDTVVVRCLEKDPERRFRSMTALADALDGILGAKKAGDPPSPVATAPSPRPEVARSAGKDTAEPYVLVELGLPDGVLPEQVKPARKPREMSLDDEPPDDDGEWAPRRMPAPGVECPRCGKHNQEHFKFCVVCGSDLRAAPDVRLQKLILDVDDSPTTLAPITRSSPPSPQPGPPSPQSVVPSTGPIPPSTGPSTQLVPPSTQSVSPTTGPVPSRTQSVVPSTQPVSPSTQSVLPSAQPVSPSTQPVAPAELRSPLVPAATSPAASTLEFSLESLAALQLHESLAPAMPQTSHRPRSPGELPPEERARLASLTQRPRQADRTASARTPSIGAGTSPIALEHGAAAIDRSRRELAAVFEEIVPPGFRDAKRFLVEFFGELFATGRRFNERVIELGAPAIRDLENRAHYVLFLDDIGDQPAGPLGELSTHVFRARVDPLAQELSALDTPPGSVLIAILAAPQLGQGARETIFTLRKERNLFVVPIAASEIRRACEAGDARRLLDHRIADLHTVSDPFAVSDGFIDPTRCIGFAAEVADLVRYITAGGKIVSVAGAPGSGKTSVVAMAEYGCDTHSMPRRFIRMSCSQLTRFDPDTLLRELLDRVDHIDAEAAGPRLSRGSTPPLDGTGIDLRATIMQLGTRPIRVEGDRARSGLQVVRPDQRVQREQLVIVLEDADWLIRLASSSEPDAERRQRARELWRSLAELCSSAGHTVVVTSVRDFQVMDQVPLERPVSVLRVPLRALNRSESDRLVMSLGEPVGFSPTRRALVRLHRESGGNVYALRLLCSGVIRALRERPDFSPLARLVVTPRMVAAAAHHIAATGSTFRPHVSVWLDDVEKVVLQHVARQRPRSPRVIRRALEGSAEGAQIARALDGLELMGLVESRRGRHRVRVPLFERWIETHLDAPPRLRDAIQRTRASRIAIGCTITALLFGTYWTWLRSTRSVASRTIDATTSEGTRRCTFELDYPDRVGPEETFALFVYQDCALAEKHELAVEPVLSALQIPIATTNCTPTTASCTTMYRPIAGQQAHGAYRVRLRIDDQPVGEALTVAIDKDRFAALRTIGEKTVPAIAFLPLLLSLALTFHKDMKRHVLRLFRRAVPAPRS